MNNEIPFKKLKIIKETENHWICRCIYCNDSDNPNHAHLYLSKTTGVFYCQRCTKSGTYKQLEHDLNEKCNIEFDNIIEYNLPNFNVKEILKKMNDIIELCSIYITDYEKEYFRKRTGLKSISLETIKKFSLFPDICARKLLYNEIICKLHNDSYRTWTINAFGTLLSGRTLDTSDNCIRYIKGKLDNKLWGKFITIDCYLIKSNIIQNFNINNPPKNLICAEGIYDITSIYLRRNKYFINDKDSIFIAVQCSSYDRAIKMYELMYNCLPNNIIIFADNGIELKTLKKQYEKAKNNNCNIHVNWPMIKDWEEAGPIKYCIDL